MKAGVVAFAFGVPGTLKSNQTIATLASLKATQLNVPVYTQANIQPDPGIKVEYTPEEPGNPPPTLCIARGAITWAQQNGFAILWVVAAKPHLWRCIRDLQCASKKIGFPVDIQICSGIESFPDDHWFCIESTQPRTRSRKDWNKRELLLRLMPMWLYERIAS